MSVIFLSGQSRQRQYIGKVSALRESTSLKDGTHTHKTDFPHTKRRAKAEGLRRYSRIYARKCEENTLIFCRDKALILAKD